jgi:hypothetical protein
VRRDRGDEFGQVLYALWKYTVKPLCTTNIYEYDTNMQHWHHIGIC